jgi:uncharacterized membrane protein SpoIIM required for sporulation
VTPTKAPHADAASPRSYEFRRERAKTWAEMERLCAQAEKSGVASLGPEQLGKLASLYRATLSSLSVARSISLDVNAVQYLESLSLRAYLLVYGPKRRLRDTVGEFLLEGLPRAVRGAWRHAALALLFMALGAAIGFVATARDPDRFHGFVSEDMAAGRGPEASTESLRDALYEQSPKGDQLASFAAQLFSHNTQIGIAAFALGFAAGAPTCLLLFINGLLIGAFGALYAGRGLGTEFWAWVLPHGVSELLAIVLCGAAGLVLADGVLFPGRHSRLDNLRLRGREAGIIVLGAGLLFVVASVIEGVFRQLVHSQGVRWSVAAGTAVFWALYFGFGGRGRKA